jgi:hypothetical protein
MKNTIIFIVLLSLLLGLLSCKSDQETQKKETLQQQSEKIGQEAAKSLRDPLDKAKNAAEQENNRIRNMEKEAEKPAN